MVSERRARAMKHGTSVVVAIPADYARGSGIRPGTALIVRYDGVVTVRKAPPEPATAPAEEAER